MPFTIRTLHLTTFGFYQRAFGKATLVNTLTINYVGHLKQVQVKITLYCKIPTCVHKFLHMLQRNRLNVPNTSKDEAKCNPKLAKSAYISVYLGVIDTVCSFISSFLSNPSRYLVNSLQRLPGLRSEPGHAAPAKIELDSARTGV